MAFVTFVLKKILRNAYSLQSVELSSKNRLKSFFFGQLELMMSKNFFFNQVFKLLFIYFLQYWRFKPKRNEKIPKAENLETLLEIKNKMVQVHQDQIIRETTSIQEKQGALNQGRT